MCSAAPLAFTHSSTWPIAIFSSKQNGNAGWNFPNLAQLNIFLQRPTVKPFYLDVLSSKALLATVTRLEKSYLKYFHKILEPAPAYEENPLKILKEYNVRIEHTGESMDNLLKIYYTKKQYPDVALFVQTSPAFCCPSLVTEAMAKTIEKKTGVPMVSITYDGTSSNWNDAIVPYLTYLQ